MNRPLITWLYSPASRRERILKALEFRPDAIIYDLEDGVAPSSKRQSRVNLAERLGTLDLSDGSLPYLEVRVNHVNSQYFADDIAMVNDVMAIRSIRVPKVDTAADLGRAAENLRPGVAIHALIETALGVENLRDICASQSVTGISLGEADLRAELRISGPEVIGHIRSRLVIALAAARKNAPMGSAFLNIHDHSGLLADTRLLAQQGFLGRTAVHPSQLPSIREAFTPTDEEFEEASKIFDSVNREVAGASSGASALADGTFIDRPVIMRAQQTIDLWEAAHNHD